MMRHLYSFCFLICLTGLTVQAKWVVPETNDTGAAPSRMTKTVVLAPAAKQTASNTQEKAKVTQPSLTSDVSRATLAMQSTMMPAVTATETAKQAKTNTPVTVAVSSQPTKPTVAASVKADSIRGQLGTRLARVTAYWAAEGDYYTGRGLSATGVHLHDGVCAVDPNIIPYGSIVVIAGLGKYVAVDTGSAVVARLAARESGHNSEEKGAIVVDIFFESQHEGEEFAAAAAKYTPITWWTPTASNIGSGLPATAAPVDTYNPTRFARSMFAQEAWFRIQGKQL
jgi:3D (Asp-Asp-Asp) domain-containing protein